MGFALLVVALAACSSPAPKRLPPPTRTGPSPDTVPFGPDDRAAELAALRDALRDDYAHLPTKQQQWGFELGALYQRYEPAIRRASTWADFEAVMVAFVAEFHDGHLQWRRKRARGEVKRTLVWLPLATRFAGGDLIVTDVGASAERAGLRRGDKLVAIDGEPIEQRLAAFGRIRSWSRLEVARYDFAGSWRSSRIVAGAPPRPRMLARERADGSRDTIALVPEEPAKRAARPAIELTWRGDVAVFRVHSLRGRVAETTKRAGDAAAAIFAKPAGLVIDLRDNDGGYEDGARAIVAALAAAPRTVTAGTARVRLSPVARAAQKAWRDLVEDPAKPGWSRALPIEVTGRAVRAYPERIAVVIDAGCRSSCETLALLLHALGARLVGERTGGSGGAPVTITLPRSGARVEIPVRAAFDLAGEPIEGRGVAPDDDIPPTRADLAADRDAALERAVAVVCTHASC